MSRAACIALALSAAACDWTGVAFFDSIPIEGTRTDDMYVYIAVDGLAASTVDRSGAFKGYSRAKFVTDFPGSSDSSWTRILRTGRMQGYEQEYYDPKADKLVNGGLTGLAKHILPAFSEKLSYEPEYLRAFDFRSHGYLHDFEVYSDTWISLGETLDELFFQLDGRAQTDGAFFAYLMEDDVLGHVTDGSDCAATIARLAQRIEDFRASHPQRRFHFTLLSDHGMDFTGMPASHFLEYQDELPKVGIAPVESLSGAAPLSVVPILHVRLMYFAMHTLPGEAAEVGKRASQMASVDFAVSHLSGETFAVYADGALLGTFEHSAGGYVLDGDFSKFGVPAGTSALSDDALFQLTANGEYPDFFYRMRTSMTEWAAQYPADVMVSTKSGYQSAGAIPRPAGDGFINAGTHGGANVDGIGVLLSDERDLPAAVRADAFLDLFPRAKQHLIDNGLELTTPPSP